MSEEMAENERHQCGVIGNDQIFTPNAMEMQEKYDAELKKMHALPTTYTSTPGIYSAWTCNVRLRRIPSNFIQHIGQLRPRSSKSSTWRAIYLDALHTRFVLHPE